MLRSLRLSSTTILCFLLSQTSSLSIRSLRIPTLQRTFVYEHYFSVFLPPPPQQIWILPLLLPMRQLFHSKKSRSAQIIMVFQLTPEHRRRNDSRNATSLDEQSDPFQHLTVLGVCGSIGSGKSFFASRLLTSKLNQDNMDTTTGPTSTHNNNKSSKNGLPLPPQAHHIGTEDSLAHGVVCLVLVCTWKSSASRN